MTLINIAEIHQPRLPGKPGRIVAGNGDKYDFWPERIEGLVEGASYLVELKPREWQGRTFYTIIKAAPAPDVPPAPAPADRALVPASSSPLDGEAQYVGRVLAAMIAAGQIERSSQIPDATVWLRKIWRES